MKNDPYFELLEIIKAQDQLERIAQRLALAAGRLAKRMDAEIKIKTTFLPSDHDLELERQYHPENFERQDD
mgnify:CR=1 FL=1